MATMRQSLALVLVGGAVFFVGRAQSQEPDPSPNKDRPLLEINLHKFGYDTSNSTIRSGRFVDFTDSSHLDLAWVTFDDRTDAAKIGMLPPKPAHLHVLVLDAMTGRKQGQQEWPTPSTPVRFSGFRDGKFLTCTGNAFHLFSPSFEAIYEPKLGSDRACLNQEVSRSRLSVLLSLYSDKSYQNTLLDLDRLAAVATWTEIFPIHDISDHWQIAFCGEPRVVCLRGIDQAWQPFQPRGLDKQMTDPMRSTAQFVNDTTLLIEAWNKMAVATVDGRVLFQVTLPKNRSFGSAVTSTGGERFAVIENRLRGVTNESLDMYAFPSNDRVVVYSIPQGRAIYAVKVKGASPWPPFESHWNQLALSPDGNLLAVISDGILKVYRLPAKATQ